ncbi:hypothetical protein ABPG72_007480 [Tetrahymena utriculariae]
MTSNFQERFKGKTSLMTKEGVDGVIKDSDNPIRKVNERLPMQMEDFTGANRYQNQKKEAQTFDINRPFFSPDRIQNPNIYSVTYSKPNKSVDQHLLVHNQHLPPIQGMYQQNLPPKYPQQINVIQYSRSPVMNEMDSIDQQMEQIKYQQQMQNQMQQQMQFQQGSRQALNSNFMTPNNKTPIMKQTFQTDNGIQSYQSNQNPKQASSLNSIKSNPSESGKKIYAPISANLNNRSQQPQQVLQAIPFKGLNSAQSSNSTTSTLQPKNIAYQKDSIDSKYSNGSQFNNIQAKNGYNMIYNNLNNSYQQNSREMLPPNYANYGQPILINQQSQPQQQPFYQLNNNDQYNNLPSLSAQKHNSQQPYQIPQDHPDFNTRAYQAKFKIKTLEKQDKGGFQQSDNQYEEAPFLKEQKKTEVQRIRNQSRDNTNKSLNEMPSSSNSLSNYKPYTLNEYKSIQKNANYKLGGLGPNVGNEDWQQKKEQLEKRQEFAKQIQQINSQVLKSQQDQGKVAAIKFNKDTSSREKALEFAKNIPKPQVNPAKGSQSTNTLGANNTLPQQQQMQLQNFKEKGKDIYGNLNAADQQENLISMNNPRNVYSSINNYQQNKDPYQDEQENQPNLSLGMNQEIDFHEQQHLEFLNQIEKMTK